MKTAGKILLGLVVLALLGWAGTFLYWHFRILGAIRTLESASNPAATPAPDPWEAELTLMDAGCRSLPHLVRALDPDKNPQFLYYCSYLITWTSVHPGLISSETGNPVWGTRNAEWGITMKDSVVDRRRKCDKMRRWWSEQGSNHHQWWRVWSSNCSDRSADEQLR